METLSLDFRYAIRGLLRSPGFIASYQPVGGGHECARHLQRIRLEFASRSSPEGTGSADKSTKERDILIRLLTGGRQ